LQNSENDDTSGNQLEFLSIHGRHIGRKATVGRPAKLLFVSRRSSGIFSRWLGEVEMGGMSTKSQQRAEQRWTAGIQGLQGSKTATMRHLEWAAPLVSEPDRGVVRGRTTLIVAGKSKVVGAVHGVAMLVIHVRRGIKRTRV
jgi:hypothetical protein